MTSEKIKLPSAVKAILETLQENGHEAVAVGGCIRDQVLGRPVHDWDIGTSALPEEVIQIFGANNTIPTGLQHGTVTVKKDGELFEVTTYRCDGDYSDGRHPDSVQYVRTIEEDLARRDFTINAMAYNESRGLIDPYDGRHDCEKGIIRAVGEPDARFTEDALRILRAVRFAAVLGFAVESTTKAAMQRHLDKLQNISRERIGAELYKTVTAPHAAEALQTGQGAVIRYICPELDACYGCAQNNRYHYLDVFGHTMQALANAEHYHRFPDEWADGYVRMALLLHDIGKPDSKTTDENGYDHFYGHASVSAQKAEQVLRRLRYSNAFVGTVVELVAAHDVEFVPTKACARRLLNKFGVDQLQRLLKLRECDNRAHTLEAWARFESNAVPFAAVLQQVLDEESAFSLKDLAINGKDLIAAGYKPGPQMGKLLNSLLDAVITEQCKNDPVDLFAYLDRCEAEENMA